jgi:hypothetical protein
MSDSDAEAFTYDGGQVHPGETVEFRYPVSETYLGDPVHIPVTIINGPRPGPTELRLSGRLPKSGITLISVGRWCVYPS